MCSKPSRSKLPLSSQNFKRLIKLHAVSSKNINSEQGFDPLMGPEGGTSMPFLNGVVELNSPGRHFQVVA